MTHHEYTIVRQKNKGEKNCDYARVVFCVSNLHMFKHLNLRPKKNLWLTNKSPEATMQILDAGPEDVKLQPSELIADPIAFPRLLFFNFTSFKYFFVKAIFRC